MAKDIPFGARARRAGQTRILRSALQAIRPDRPVAAFDLDSTVLVNKQRQARIVREYGERIGDTRLLACTVQAVPSWHLSETLRLCGLAEPEIANLVPGLRDFWRERFFTSEYCRSDTAVPGAPEFVRAAVDAGAEVVYVTGRPVGMREGTLEAFQRQGFPLPDGKSVQLWLKPDLADDDDRWKEICQARLKELRGLACAFDNEPTHVNGYKRSFPQASVVHLDTDHSGRPVEVLPEIPSILDFVMEP